MESHKLIDLSYLEKVCGGNKAMVSKMIDLFVEQTPLQMEQMQQYSENGDWDEFFKVAHKAKSSLAMMGVKSLSSSMLNLEEYAKSKENLDKIDGILQHVKETCKLVLDEIVKDYADLKG